MTTLHLLPQATHKDTPMIRRFIAWYLTRHLPLLTPPCRQPLNAHILTLAVYHMTDSALLPWERP